MSKETTPEHDVTRAANLIGLTPTSEGCFGSEHSEYGPLVRRLFAHADALTALDAAVKGCGKAQSYFHYPDEGAARDYTRCGEGILDICLDCRAAKEASVLALLGRTGA